MSHYHFSTKHKQGRRWCRCFSPEIGEQMSDTWGFCRKRGDNLGISLDMWAAKTMSAPKALDLHIYLTFVPISFGRNRKSQWNFRSKLSDKQTLGTSEHGSRRWIYPLKMEVWWEHHRNKCGAGLPLARELFLSWRASEWQIGSTAHGEHHPTITLASLRTCSRWLTHWQLCWLTH